jgi:hypothetical protein
MKLQPNTQLSYKSGNRRITVWLRNQIEDGEHAGKIYFNVNIKQASKSFTGGAGYVNPETGDVVETGIGSGGAKYLAAALVAA